MLEIGDRERHPATASVIDIGVITDHIPTSEGAEAHTCTVKDRGVDPTLCFSWDWVLPTARHGIHERGGAALQPSKLRVAIMSGPGEKGTCCIIITDGVHRRHELHEVAAALTSMAVPEAHIA
jgi:hypothetical protein